MMYNIFISILSMFLLYKMPIPAVLIEKNENIQSDFKLNEDLEQIWQVTLVSRNHSV